MNSTPQQMNASVLIAPETIEVQTLPVPTLGDRDVLVRVEAVGVCGSDTHFYRSGRIGDLVVDGPVVLGHETSGTIVAVGARVAPDRVGQLVSIEPQRPCRHCRFCRSGDYNQCEQIEFYGAFPVDGSFSEYVSIPDDFAYAVPAGVSAAEAALVEPLSVAVYAARRAALKPEDRLLIAGAGPIGLLIAMVAREFSVGHIAISDPQDARREAAARLTTAEVHDPRDIGDERFDVFIDASGAPAAIRSGIHAVDTLGRVVLVGMGMDDVELPVSVIQHREITVTGTFRYAHTWPLAIHLLGSGRINLKPLVSATFPLDRVEEALLAGGANPSVIKAVVEPQPAR